jgi:hypothetical protein
MQNQIPEFSASAATVAFGAASLGYLWLRKRGENDEPKTKKSSKV